MYGTRQGTLKSDSERRGEWGSLFNVRRAIRRAVSYYFFQCPLFKALFNVCRAIRHSRRSPRRSPRQSPFAGPFPIICFQCSFKVRCSIFAAPFGEPFVIRRDIRCRFSMSPNTFHTYRYKSVTSCKIVVKM